MYCRGAGSLARGGHHDRVVHGAVLVEPVHHLRDGRLLLPDRDVDAEDAGLLLVDDGVDRDRGLAGLAVADDQLALAAADRRHGVDRLDARLERLVHGAARHDAGRLQLDAAALLAPRSPACRRSGSPSASDHAADQLHAHRHLEDAAGAAHAVALADVMRLAHHRDADVVLFEVQHQPGDAARELDQLAGHHLLEPEDARDAVADGEHGAGLGDVDLAAVLLDLALQDVRDLGRFDVHRSSPFAAPSARTAGSSVQCCFVRLPWSCASCGAQAAVEDHAADAARPRRPAARRSTPSSSSTCLPVRAASARRRRSRWSSRSRVAETTLARTRPAASSASRPYSSQMASKSISRRRVDQVAEEVRDGAAGAEPARRDARAPRGAPPPGAAGGRARAAARCSRRRSLAAAVELRRTASTRPSSPASEKSARA